MSSNSIKNELANHIYQYLCHEAQYSDLPEAARESLTAASECIEQAYKLNVNQPHSTNNNSAPSEQATNSNAKQTDCSGTKSSSDILPDELLKIFTRHKEYLAQQKDSLIYPHTTRKKLSHLRAQIKRQASKAARSRLEKRSSVSGTAGSSSISTSDKIGHHFGFGVSLDTSNSKHQLFHKQQKQQQPLDGHNVHHKDQHNQPNSSSSMDSPNAYLISQSTSSPQTNTSSTSAAGTSNQDQMTSSNISPNQLNECSEQVSGSNKHESTLKVPSGSHHHNHHPPTIGNSVHQKNFKQKLIALLKKFRTDGSDFDSEEQYREALERELMKAAAGRGSRAIEELLEEDIDVDEESGSELEDWDNISETSTPKPSLRPFFSSTTLDQI